MNESIRKRIFVIGGGISGLAALHYLKLRYQKCPEVEIVLLEKRSVPGGVIGTEMISDARFETGSNGFLNTQPLTFQLIEELGLKDQLIEAFPDNKVRFLCVKNKLYPLPANPLGLLSFPLLSAADKLALLKESFVKSKGRENETVYEFVSRRLSPGWAKMLADPMISGIYAGDAREIVLRDAFPTLAELEAEHGSLLKGLMAARKKGGGGKSLYSLSEGMGSIIHALYQKYQAHIRLNQDVDDIRKEANGQYLIRTDEQLYTADQVFLTVPAYAASDMLRAMDTRISDLLDQIQYAPVALVGLVCAKEEFVNLPAGFGYLKPSAEKSPVMGVLFEDQIFENRAATRQCLLRIMIGGMHNLQILKYSKEELIAAARKEVIQVLGFKGEPFHIFFQAWSNAIPQYDLYRHRIRPQIAEGLVQHPNFHITANYWNGVCVNDCLRSAHQTVADSQWILN